MSSPYWVAEYLDGGKPLKKPFWGLRECLDFLYEGFLLSGGDHRAPVAIHPPKGRIGPTPVHVFRLMHAGPAAWSGQMIHLGDIVIGFDDEDDAPRGPVPVDLSTYDQPGGAV